MALLAKAAPDLPDPVLDHGHLAEEPARAYDALRETLVDAQLLVDHCQTLLRHRYGDDYAVIEAAPLLDAGALDNDGNVRQGRVPVDRGAGRRLPVRRGHRPSGVLP
ncbi:hypothetical protein, partial [Streptomyces spectabilis]|uniref:hypothetical protein n=1 Tax=Streptomyces spectabilis TaxID=68270 RepID=UPI0033ED442D